MELRPSSKDQFPDTAGVGEGSTNRGDVYQLCTA